MNDNVVMYQCFISSSIYTFSNWGIALQDFLGIGLEVWAWENPTIWENTRGISVYSFNEAWGKSEPENPELTSNVLYVLLNASL
jgi:hypothetical protein